MIIKNPYIDSCESSTFSVLFDYFNWRDDIQLIHGLMKYPEWKPNVNILNFIKNLEELRYNANCYFVFDASTEGFSPFKNFFFHNLYESCRLHNIKPNKIIFVSTNMKDLTNIERYNKENRIQESIRVFPFLSFKKMIQDLIEDNYGFNFNSNSAFEYFKSECDRKFSGDFGLSLSRVNRSHRTLAHYLLHSTNLDRHFKLSQDRISEDDIRYTAQHYLLDKNFLKWCSTLPKVVDTEDFETNHALSINSHLHNSTLFQIVNETHVKNWQNTSLFYSEKTFRSMAHMQPFLIFGQPGCNRKLEQLGFRLFREDFDYSFDDIQDTKKRYLAIIDTIRQVVKQLNEMNRDEQIKWRFRREETLKHNFDLVMDINYFRQDFEKLIEAL